MKNIFKASLYFLLVVSVFSCGDNTGDGGVNGLEVTITGPADSSTFVTGDTIVLSFTVKDDIDITSIAWNTAGNFGTGSVPGAELLGDITEYSGEFMIVADAPPGTYEIDVSATDEEFNNVETATLTVLIL